MVCPGKEGIAVIINVFEYSGLHCDGDHARYNFRVTAGRHATFLTQTSDCGHSRTPAHSAILLASTVERVGLPKQEADPK